MTLDSIFPMTAATPERAPNFRARREAALAALIPPFVHKLNNLLGAALGFSDMLMTRQDNPRAGELLAGIHEGTDDAVGLLRFLAEFAKPTLDAPEAVDAADLLRSVAALVQPLAESGRARIDLALERPGQRGGARTVRLPRRAVMQRLAVAIAEAILALPEAERDPSRRTLRLSLRPNGDTLDLVLTVPSGAGLPMPGRAESEELGVLERATGRAREMRLGGSLVRSVRLRVPALESAWSLAPEEAAELTARAPQPIRTVTLAPARDPRGQRILLFERDGALGELIGDVLAETGYTVERLDGALACRTRLLEIPPDVLLLDRPLEATDGEELGELAQLAADNGVCVGVLGPELGSVRLRTLGKPFRPGELIEFVATLR